MTIKELLRVAALDAVRLGRRATAPETRQPSPAPMTPPGWHTAPPDFVGVGVRGAATDWWLAQIERHPAIARAPGAPRAVHWFYRFWTEPFPDGAGSDYAGWFPRPEGSLAGEWTPTYLSDFWMPPLLARTAPEARILVLLRDPVARYAAARRTTWDEREAIGQFQAGLVAADLRALLSVFPRDLVLILQEEACLADVAPQLARTWRFLGLPDSTPTSPGPEPPLRRPSDLPSSVREALIAAYATEREQLAELAPDIDLSLWSGAT